VLAAARNNAEWCDLVCRSHGLPTAFSDWLWIAPKGSPPLYPDAVTLAPGVPVDAVLREIELGPGCSVKDSFADLELGEEGFIELFEASWLTREQAPPDAPPRLRWRVVTDDVVNDPAVRFLEVDGGGAVVNKASGMVGVTNVVTTGVNPELLWSDLPAAIGKLFERLPLVGYEHGEARESALASGFQAIGPLRIWLQR
jgi:hypothetical protein